MYFFVMGGGGLFSLILRKLLNTKMRVVYNRKINDKPAEAEIFKSKSYFKKYLFQSWSKSLH